MSQYRTGAASLTGGSWVVTGSGTAWSSQAKAGDLFTVTGYPAYGVGRVVSDTELWLTAPWGGSDLSGVAYAISRDFTPAMGLPLVPFGAVGTDSLLSRAMAQIDGYMAGVIGLRHRLRAGETLVVGPDCTYPVHEELVVEAGAVVVVKAGGRVTGR